MFKRKIYERLLDWKKQSKAKTALLIEGARRIGKTTVVEEFAKNEFPGYVLIDFSQSAKKYEPIFQNIDKIDEFFSELFLQLNSSVLPRGSLIVFDEVQFLPIARQAIKHLVKDGRYFYIETGSLVSIKENTQNILIPSEEESIDMFPMDYEEFLWALGLEYEAEQIRGFYNVKKLSSENINQILIKHYRQYLAIGGMPQAVSTYLETNDYYAVDKIKRNIIRIYEEDLKKIDNQYGTICYSVWERMPEMLSNHSTRFRLSSIDARSDSILFARTMDKLIESKMVLPVYRSNEPTGGFKLTKDEKNFKLYFSDVGLFTSTIFSDSKNDKQNIYQKLVLDDLSTNLGMLFENVVAQSFYTQGYMPYYYSWSDEKQKKLYEVDFLLYKNGKVFPFEVKSNKTSAKASILKFKEKYSKCVGEQYYITTKPLKYGNNETYLPFYMLFCFN